MFGTTRAFGSFAVDDIAAARKFYGETLGLRVSDVTKHGPLMLHIGGDQEILVYPKPEHTPATFTLLNFPVDDIERAVDDLTDRGVRIQRYEGYEMDDRGIVHGPGHLIAWFNDPAGNGPAVVQTL